jgi:Rod binding domain-containing protein
MQIGLSATNPDLGGLRLSAELQGLERRLAGLEAAKGQGAGQHGAEAKVAEAGRELEALFATMLVKELRRSLPGEGFFPEGPGADTYNAWFDEHLGRTLAANGFLELAGMVKTAFGAGGKS